MLARFIVPVSIWKLSSARIDLTGFSNELGTTMLSEDWAGFSSLLRIRGFYKDNSLTNFLFLGEVS